MMCPLRPVLSNAITISADQWKIPKSLAICEKAVQDLIVLFSDIKHGESSIKHNAGVRDKGTLMSEVSRQCGISACCLLIYNMVDHLIRGAL